MKNIINKNLKRGFTLVELLVVIAIIGILAGIVYANFGDARATSRDQARKVALKELQLAIELYKAQEGDYPSPGCGVTTGWTSASCDEYIEDLAPEYIPSLPKDPQTGNSYIYRSNTNNYKLYTPGVEKEIVTTSHEFARCPSFTNCGNASASALAKTYAVYKGPNATQW